MGLSGLNYRAEEKVRHFQERVASTKSSVDCRPPRSWAEKKSGHVSPSKKKVAKRERDSVIALDNMLLARRIFDIMEAPGTISSEINDTRHLDVHPGTMNFKSRIEESEKIHHTNMVIAERLAKITPFYGYDDLNANRGMLGQKHADSNTNVHTKKDGTSKMHRSENENDGSLTYRSEGGSSYVQSSPVKDSGPHSARGLENASGASLFLLQSFKIQDGQRIELVILKEPFRDNYTIFGKMNSDGQKYEISFTSEEVCNIVDGDLLVTSIESGEVWEVLLLKTTLPKIKSYSETYNRLKLKIDSYLEPSSPTSHASAFQSPNAAKEAKKARGPAGGVATAHVPGSVAGTAAKSPAKPKNQKPSSRPGGRAGKGVQNNQNNQKSEELGNLDSNPETETENESKDAKDTKQSQSQGPSKVEQNCTKTTIQTQPKKIRLSKFESVKSKENAQRELDQEKRIEEAQRAARAKARSIHMRGAQMNSHNKAIKEIKNKMQSKDVISEEEEEKPDLSLKEKKAKRALEQEKRDEEAQRAARAKANSIKVRGDQMNSHNKAIKEIKNKMQSKDVISEEEDDKDEKKEQDRIAEEIGDSDEAHSAATKLQAIQRSKKARAEVTQLKGLKEQERIAEEIGDSEEVHSAASKLQAVQRSKKAKQEVAELKGKKEQERISEKSVEVKGEGKEDPSTQAKQPVPPSEPKGKGPRNGHK